MLLIDRGSPWLSFNIFIQFTIKFVSLSFSFFSTSLFLPRSLTFPLFHSTCICPFLSPTPSLSSSSLPCLSVPVVSHSTPQSHRISLSSIPPEIVCIFRSNLSFSCWFFAHFIEIATNNCFILIIHAY